MKISEIYAFLDEIAPFENAADFDNCGLLLGDMSTEISRILVALDATSAVAQEARERRCELIITHHPVIFQPVKQISMESTLAKLIKNGTAVISVHTNLDKAEHGVNFQLAKKLGLTSLRRFLDRPYVIVGDLPEKMTAVELARFVKARLESANVRFMDAGEKILTVAVSCGAGGNQLEAAKCRGAQAFLTGEMKHHEFLTAYEIGVSAFDVGHFSSENVVVEPLAYMLRENFKGLEIFISSKCTDRVQAV